MTPEEVKSQFNEPAKIAHFRDAAVDIGLWRSEEIVFSQVFRREDALLEIGCGAGRIGLGLWELGYRCVLGTDYSREMIQAGRDLARKLEYAVPFRVADATKLPFEDDLFDGAVFGFNGLMQIPGRRLRRAALGEAKRVIKPGGKFVFTTHDRDVGSKAGFWACERKRWNEGEQNDRLVEFGDRLVETDHGEIFIHIPNRAEVLEDIEATGWQLCEDRLRSELIDEPDDVKAFSTDCRFWIVQKPAALS